MPVPRELLTRAQEMEPLPSSTARLMALRDESDFDAGDVAVIIEEDAALAGHVMRVAGSSVFGARGRPASMQAAVARIGTETVWLIALGAHLRSQMVDTRAYELSQQQHWQHALASVTAVRELITRRPGSGLDGGALLSALAHDIGKVLIDEAIGPEVSVQKKASDCDVTFVEAEQRLAGCNHAEVGGVVATAWCFPAEVCHAIESHHDLDVEPTPYRDAITLGNLVAKTVGAGVGAEGLNVQLDASALQRLGVDQSLFFTICSETAAQLANRETVYGD